MEKILLKRTKNTSRSFYLSVYSLPKEKSYYAYAGSEKPAWQMKAGLYEVCQSNIQTPEKTYLSNYFGKLSMAVMDYEIRRKAEA